MIIFKQTQSNDKPLEYEVRQNEIYFRRNIQRILKFDEIAQLNYEMWDYLEAYVLKDFYLKHFDEVNTEIASYDNIHNNKIQISDTQSGLMETYEKSDLNSQDIKDLRISQMETYELIEQLINGGDE